MLASFINKIRQTFFILNHLPKAASVKNRSNYCSMLEKALRSVGYSVASGSMSFGTCPRDRDRKLYFAILRLKMASIHIKIKRKQKNEPFTLVNLFVLLPGQELGGDVRQPGRQSL